jgi:hypothetical protein
MARAGWVIVVALAYSAGGCLGEDDDDGGVPITIGSPGLAGDPCDEWRAWKLRCTPDASADDLDYYDECRMLHWNKVQPAFTRSMAECFPTLSCDDADDACSARGFTAIGVTKESVKQDTLVQGCLSAIDGCNFGDDLCIGLTALTKPARAEAAACPTASCGGYDACVRTILGEPARGDKN